MKCDICGKEPMFGHAISHSKIHSKRTFDPNIHPTKIEIDGKLKRVNICTRCLRTHNKLTRAK